MSQKCNEMFAKRFKELRIGSGYTQQQIANLLNVTRACICYWETGNRVPDYLNLIELARFFNVSTDYLLGLSDNKIDIFCEKERNTSDYLDISVLNIDNKRQITDFYNFLLEKQSKNDSIPKKY